MDGAPIRFLGLWDAVASFGLPGNDLNFAWHLTPPGNVVKCCHAMALDERRGNFLPTRVKAPRAGQAVDGPLEEVWFRGVHSDVGGGASVGLSSIALCWMLRRAVANGLPMDEPVAGASSFCAIPTRRSPGTSTPSWTRRAGLNPPISCTRRCGRADVSGARSTSTRRPA